MRLFDDWTPNHRLLTWPGAKYRQMPEIIKYFPGQYRNLCEPFLGSGSFTLTKFDDVTENFYLSDKQSQLLNLWDKIFNHCDKFIEYCVNIRQSYDGSKEKYYDLKDNYNNLVDLTREEEDFIHSNSEFSCELAAMTWCMSYMCMNNMVRFTKEGYWGQSWGENGTKKGIGEWPPDPVNIFTNEYRCKLAELNSRMHFFNDFVPCLDSFLADANEDDICFLDPPYILSSELYDMSWTIDDEKCLFEYIRELDNIGVRWMMSNYLFFGEYTHPFIDTITKLYDIKELPRRIDPTPFQESIGNTKRYGIEYMIVSKRYPFKY